MVPSLLDIEALDPVKNVIITCLDPDSDHMIVTALVNDCLEVSDKIQMEAASRSALEVEMSRLRKSCQGIGDDIDAITKATEERRADDKLFCENTEKCKTQRLEIEALKVEKDRLQKVYGTLEEELSRLKEQDRQIQTSYSPTQVEIQQQTKLQEEHRSANKQREKELSQMEKSLGYDEHRLECSKSNLRQLMKDREDLVVSTYTHEDMDALTAMNEMYNRLTYFLIIMILFVLATLIYVFVTRCLALFN